MISPKKLILLNLQFLKKAKYNRGMLIKGMIPFPFSVKKQEHMSLWDTVKGPSPDLKGKTPFTPTVVLLQAIQFLPTIPLPGRGIPLQGGDNRNKTIS